MSTCDLCGKSAELYRAVIEDVELNVCQRCSAYGKVVGKSVAQLPRQRIINQPESNEDIELIVEDYAGRIKRSREALGLTQQEFSKKINEKESLIHKIETGSIRPSIELAKKLERLLKVRLIEHYEESHEAVKSKKDDGMTLGDFIKVRK